ncbi:hypothetical protein K505DRAFT_236610 [Melanomma pulvis-pyrius CBS 109.77]|uniref:Gfd2/YDR514C-like C-terminal domain-containing protein n=1 Tax=Melanomma pulvis-pyrius CBS 109.77 TaxID=1314802 RepID=A0A6A6XLX1_9PLEO|nr:hypothetical protein K505DRAFT_236610 [Melanomma pulvis-pyrius CBS 109.77]
MSKVSANPYKGIDPRSYFLAHHMDMIHDPLVLRQLLDTEVHNWVPDLKGVAIIALTAAWWEKEPHSVTELGIAELPLPVPYDGTGDFDHAVFEKIEGIFMQVKAIHARIKPNAHLFNKFPGSGNPDKFNFGRTVFVNIEEARQGLLSILCRPGIQGPGFQPVVLVGHAIHNHIARINEAFKLDILSLGSVIKVLDTQSLAKDVGIKPPKGTNISLMDLSRHFGMIPDNLHTAGNDVVHILINAVFASLQSHPFGFGSNNRTVGDFTERINMLVNRMMQVGKVYPPQNWGTLLFCTRCDRDNHLKESCHAAYICCTICVNSPNMRNRKGARSHQTAKCIFAPVPESKD